MAFVRDPNNLIPIMSADSQNGITLTASSCYGTPYELFKAFDGMSTASDLFNAARYDVTPWINIQFSTPKIINKYSLSRGTSNDTYQATAWKIQGYTGSSYVDLDTQTGQFLAVDNTKSIYTVSSTTAYAVYRLQITANGGTANWFELGELELCFPHLPKLPISPSPSLLSSISCAGGGY